MYSGDPDRRTFDGDASSGAISYVCLDYSGSSSGNPAYAQRNSFFAQNCPNGLRAQVNFPSCWDGVNLDSSDHRSHMAFASGGPNGGGDCPASHPVHLVSLFYEFFFSVQNFPYNDPKYPTWVWANGDATGYGLHADFLSGWPSLSNGTNVLQQAIDQCNQNDGVGGNLQDCPPFVPYLDSASANACRPQNAIVNEDIGLGHYISSLPGDNPLWIGNVSKPTTAGYSDSGIGLFNATSTIPSGFNYVGCIAEGASGRALTGPSTSNANMTRGACVSFCQSYGMPLAGVEYGRECYCDVQIRNGATNTTFLTESSCGMRCANNTNENCGGSQTLNLYVNPSLFPAPVAVPTGWTAKACMTEATSGRALASYSLTDPGMTPQMCMNACQAKGYAYAGVEYASQCFCGNAFAAGSVNANSASECNMQCAGDKTQTCGGSNRLNVYVSANAPSSTTTTSVALPSGWTAKGCYTEATNSRALTSLFISDPKMTPLLCMTTCQQKGYMYAGVEYASQCFCGNSIVAGSVSASSSDCSMPCSGDSTQMCGGNNRLNLFLSSNPAPTAAAPTLPTGWAANGCVAEPSSGRALSQYSFTANNMTPQLCAQTCQSKG